MSTFRVATFNLAFFGTTSTKWPQWHLTDDRLRQVAASIRHLSADLLVFQEIIDPWKLEEVLSGQHGAVGRSLTIRDGAGQLIATADDPGTWYPDMRVVVAVNPDVWTVQGWRTRREPDMTRPILVAELLHRASQKLLIVIGAHLKSPSVLDTPTPAQAISRRAELEAIREEATSAAAASGGRVVLAGDFNGTIDGQRQIHSGVAGDAGAPDPEMAALLAQLPGWHWPRPLPSDGVLEWTTSAYSDNAAIDFIVASPALGTHALPAQIHRLDQLLGPGWLGTCTDHRPVTMDLQL